MHIDLNIHFIQELSTATAYRCRINYSVPHLHDLPLAASSNACRAVAMSLHLQLNHEFPIEC